MTIVIPVSWRSFYTKLYCGIRL